MPHDLVIRGGRIHDGLGSPPLDADVAVSGDRIAEIGPDLGPGRRTIDAHGHLVTPGFVDAHSHSDTVPLLDGAQPFKLLQGVTTEIVGNCGFSPAPLTAEAVPHAAEAWSGLFVGDDPEPRTFAAWLARIERAGPTNHLAPLVGHGTLRLAANGTDEELRAGAVERMCELADAAFAAGAVGLSTGLIYVPGAYAGRDEIAAVTRVAGRWGRPYATHMRDEGDALEDALDEAIAIGRTAGVRVQISHCKASGRANHGRSVTLLDRLRAARREGIDVRGDQYPYTAGSTLLAALLPPRANVGGVDALRERLADHASRERLRSEATAGGTGGGLWGTVRPDDVLIVAHVRGGTVGRRLADVAGGDDPFAVACDLIAADPAAQMVVELMAEDDVRTIMADPLIAVGSDNGPPVGMGHPRTWGCFPRFFGRYVRDLGVVGWPEAVRKATSATAAQFGLVGRGRLVPGAIADVCVLDPATIGHAGTYAAPDVPPTGVETVLLAGRVVVDHGSFTGGRHGRVLRAG